MLMMYFAINSYNNGVPCEFWPKKYSKYVFEYPKPPAISIIIQNISFIHYIQV